ncbi:EFR1 family ferrodoxin [Ihubacter sp. rT4E-8]|uniref:EFR1 family ferrodoxin n=1 Tax=Ihubacter sp. rT4E-8 TaxID=3242369 RepID=UPI003CE8DA34
MNYNVKRIWAISFSPTGSTAQVVFEAAERAAAELGGLPVHTVDLTTPFGREDMLCFGTEDMVFVGMPTYAGRLPNKIMPFIRDMIKGSGASGIPVVTFGGRNFDDSLAELTDLMEENGFKLAGGGAFVCRHAFVDIAVDRPDEEDASRAAALGVAVAKNIQAGREVAVSEFPGNHPAGSYYVPKGVDGQPAVFLKAKPQIDEEKCVHCGRCAEICPMGSIEKDTLQATGICIKCQACISHCPVDARYFDDTGFLSHKRMLEETFADAKPENLLVI